MLRIEKKITCLRYKTNDQKFKTTILQYMFFKLFFFIIIKCFLAEYLSTLMGEIKKIKHKCVKNFKDFQIKQFLEYYYDGTGE